MVNYDNAMAGSDVYNSLAREGVEAYGFGFTELSFLLAFSAFESVGI